jgi:hypothetical protein
MSSENPMRARVRHTKLAGKAVAAGLAKLETTCAAGAACAEVQASPLAALALQGLQTATAAARASHLAVLDARAALRAAVAALAADLFAAAVRLRVFEKTVDGLAGGNAAVITAAGLLARPASTPPSALGDVVGVSGKAGLQPGEAVLAWPRVKGATGYAVEVCFTPASPDGPWTALANGTRRRRVVRAPGPGAQILARVAAVARDGTRSAWSLPILVTAR